MCWYFMTPAQRSELAEEGIANRYGGGPCPSPARVAVRVGPHPGPRFQCADPCPNAEV